MPRAKHWEGPRHLAPRSMLRRVFRQALGGSAAAERHVTDLVEEHRPLEWIQLRDVRRKLREERIAQNGGRLLMAAAARIAKQLRDVDLQRIGQTLQRGE